MIDAPEDRAIRTMASLNLDYSKAVASSENFAKVLAQLDAQLAKFRAATLKGVQVPGLDDMTDFVNRMRQAVVSGSQLSEEHQKLILTSREWAAITSANVQKQQTITKAVAEEAKTRQGLATLDSQLAAQRSAAEEKAAKLVQDRFQKEQLLRAQEALAEQQANERVYLKIPALQAELASMQQTVANRHLESTELAHQINLERQKIDLLEKERATGTEITAAMRAQTAEIEKNATVLKSNLQTVTSDTGATGQQGFWERRFGWFVAGASFYGTMRLIREAFQNMADIESKMTVIRRVSNEATADFTQMQKELLDLGVRMGQSWDDTSKIAIMWSQAGFNMRDTLELTKVSLLAMNTAELSATESTSGLISVMAQWDLQANQLLPTLDKVNLVADRYAVTSGDLISGLQRSSGAARLLGMSLEETISLLTVLREGSGRTGKEVGNALNSILSFIQRPNTRKALMDAGIEVWADTAQSQMRNVMDILRDTSKAWNGMSEDVQKTLADSSLVVSGFTEEIDALSNATKTLTQTEQMELGQAMAGTYRRNYMNILLQDFAKTESVVLQMETALGYSLKENALYLETYEAKVQQLKSAWVQASTSLAQSGLFDGLKFIVDTGRATLDVFNAMPAPIRAATTMLAAYGAALTVVNMLQRMFEKTAIATALTKIGASLTTFLAPVGGALPVLLGGAALIGLVRETVETNRQFNIMADAYAKIGRKVAETKKDTEEYDSVLKEEQEVLNALGKKFPELITAMDDLGNVRGIDESKISRFRSMKTEVDNLTDSLEDLKTKLAETMAQIAVIEGQKYSLPQGEMPGDRPVSEGGIPYTGTFPALSELRRQALEYGEAIGSMQNRLDEARSGAAGKGLPFDADLWRANLDRVLTVNHNLELSLLDVQKQVRLTAMEEGRLRDALASTAEVEGAVSRSTKALAQENVVLSNINATLYAKMEMVLGLQKEAQAVMSDHASDDALRDATESYERANSQIRSLTSEINTNTLKIRENEIAIEKAGRSVSEYYREFTEKAKRSYDEIYNLSRKTFEHQARMLNTSLEFQIRYYQKLTDLYKGDQEKRWDIEEKLQGLYRDALKDQIENVKDAYDEQIKVLRKNMDLEIKIRQDQIDAIDAIEKGSDRSEAARQHSEKIKEIEDKLAYERLRTGIEHERNIVDLEKEKSEELIRWQREQDQWSRDDRKKALQNEIDDIKESYEDRQRELEDAWKKAEKFLTAEFVTILSTAAVYDSKWYQKGIDWATQLANGIRDGITAADLNSLISGLSGNISGAPSQSSIIANSQALLQAKRDWEDANRRGDQAAMDRAAARGQAIRASGPTLDQNMTLTGDELEARIRNSSFDTGGKALNRGLAILDPGEWVLKQEFSQNIERFLENMGSSMSTVYNITSPLVKFEKIEVHDHADAEWVVETVDRHVKGLLTGKGVITRGAVV